MRIPYIQNTKPRAKKLLLLIKKILKKLETFFSRNNTIGGFKHFFN